MGKVIAVTGAAGYFGQVLTNHLLAQPWVERVIALDLREMQSHRRLISYRVDTRESNLLRAILAEHGVTHFVHAAFFVNPPAGMSEEQHRANNIDGAQFAIRNALEFGVEQFVFISSVAVYGYHPHTPQNVPETFRLYPNWTYGKQKVAVEAFLSEYGKHFPGTIRTTIRPTAIIGRLGRQYSALRELIKRNVFIVSNRGRALTQAVHEDDCADLVIRALNRGVPGTYHAAPDDSISWEQIGGLTGLPIVRMPRPVLEFLPHLKALFPAVRELNDEIISYLSESLTVSNHTARRDLGWKPTYTSADAFRELFTTVPPDRPSSVDPVPRMGFSRKIER